jgi:hypothetical protein
MIHGFLTGMCLTAVFIFWDLIPMLSVWFAFLAGMNFMCATRRKPDDIPDWVRKELE